MGRKIKALLAMVLTLAICLSCVAGIGYSAKAEGETTYTQVTSVEDVKEGGQFVLVVEYNGVYYALDTTIKGKPAAVEVTVADGKVTADTLPVWTVAASDDGISLNNGTQYIKYKSGTNAEGSDSAYTWNLQANADGTAWALIASSKTDRALAYNYNGGNYRFGGYSTTNLESTDYAFYYTFFAATTGSTTPEQPAEPSTVTVEDGDYVIWAPAVNKALSVDKVNETSYYNKGVDVTLGDDLTGYGNTEIWTLKLNEDGKSYTISCGEEVLAMSTYSSLTHNAENDEWVLEDAGDGCYYVKNVNRERYLQWNTQYENWSTGSAVEENNVYAVKLTVAKTVTEQPEQPEEPEVPTKPETPIAEGEYVIWAPAHNIALTDVKTGNYNVGDAVELKDGKLNVLATTTIWTVELDEETGIYTISVDGKKLSMDDEETYLQFDMANAGWIIEAVDGGYYVKNTVRQKYEKPYAIEWYAAKENWSTYHGISGSEDLFTLQFTPVADVVVSTEAPEVPAEPTPVTDIETGNYVIWVPKYNIALSTEKVTEGSYYNKGVEVTLTEDVLSGYTDAEVWTITNNGDGTYTISCSKGALSISANYNSPAYDEVNATWQIVKDEAGNLYVKNVGKGNYLGWGDYYGSWSTYSSKTGDEGQYIVQLTAVQEAEQPEVPGVDSGDNSQMVLWTMTMVCAAAAVVVLKKRRYA